ncbi:hypothetical protein Clacol_008234 [Clathrus columnatus]|uniref:Alpha-mannosidase n=1 Tax=Clathrus columnatus TaxID=1419009 RepID=A0AAV5AJY8_9AGAM|nr:hypothetical protein Clacol_008234 [Clathrus columnatus]
MEHQHRGASHAVYSELNFTPGNKWVKSLTQGRLGTMLGGHYSSINLSSVLFHERIDDLVHVKLQVWSAPNLTKPSFSEAMKQEFKPTQKGDSFGPSSYSNIASGIPSSWAKYERVQFEFDPGCEAMVFRTDGTPVQGITGGYGGDRRVEYIIPEEARKRGFHEFVIEQTCNGMFGVPLTGDTIDPPALDRYYQLASADLVVPNQEAWHLMWDFFTLKQLSETLPGNTPLQNKALVVANAIMNTFSKEDVKSIPSARKLVEEIFGEAWFKKAENIYKEGDTRAKIYAIGHCHIDTAWLWPYSATQQKVARSWSTQIDLMERYPEHRFVCSSAQQYKWLEQLYPLLFERVKEKIVSGQFHPVGGQWLESDGNMPSGEAFVRQFVLGQRYFQTRFGIRCGAFLPLFGELLIKNMQIKETAWLPDSFGLNGALPQLIRGAGMKYFFTQKLSWNNINTFPHSTFNWVGIDSTQVLCHMTPVDTYTAQATVADVMKGVSNHKNLESSSTALLVFGNGDGGGGPLAPMLENLRRIRATGNNNREIPLVNMGGSVDDFFHDLEEDTNAGLTIPTWRGELYLEFHRGTYTSHGSIKKGNRKSEILLREIEHLATIASLYDKEKYAYPQRQIDDLWENVLLNQFHDVLPGSAIGMVYEDAEQIYAYVKKEGEELLENAMRILIPKSTSVSMTQPLQSAVSGKIVAYNTTPFRYSAVVEVPLQGVGGNLLKAEIVQISQHGNSGFVLMDASIACGPAVPRGIFADMQPTSAKEIYKDVFVLQNSKIKLTITDGRITSLVDTQQRRELIPTGKTGGLIIYDDRPNYWDAWDVEIHHLETPHVLRFTTISVAEKGPVRASLVGQLRYGKSTIKITMSLDAIAATLDVNSNSFIRFDAEVDWHERHKFLKFELPVNIHNEDAVYEAPFGYVKRPTHKNTSLDLAKFEVCAHKYADLSEYGYGVAILSESKYGFSTRGNIMAISLLRAATAPDAEQDQGKHQFSWAVYPHKGSFLESDVPMAAYVFNSPLRVRFVADDQKKPMSLPQTPFSLTGASNVVLDTIKRGDDDDPQETDWKKGSSTVILRLYEAFGGHASVRINIASNLGVSKATITNLLEEDMETLEINKIVPDSSSEQQSYIDVNFRGFQVMTIKLVISSVTWDWTRRSRLGDWMII